MYKLQPIRWTAIIITYYQKEQRKSMNLKDLKFGLSLWRAGKSYELKLQQAAMIKQYTLLLIYKPLIYDKFNKCV